MPDYVEHRDGATEIGKLSAEAVVREYEAAAKDIEAMGAELIEHVKQCEAMTRDALAVTEEMKETARRYREEAKRVFLQIENCSLMTAEVRKTCTELKERIAAPATVELNPQEISSEPRKEGCGSKIAGCAPASAVNRGRVDHLVEARLNGIKSAAGNATRSCWRQSQPSTPCCWRGLFHDSVGGVSAIALTLLRRPAIGLGAGAAHQHGPLAVAQAVRS